MQIRLARFKVLLRVLSTILARSICGITILISTSVSQGAEQPASSKTLSSPIAGVDIRTLKPVSISLSEPGISGNLGKKNGRVVVFLSARCPCSNSHVSELKELSEAYKSFDFIAIHSNVDEPEEEAKPYFQKLQLPFPVIQDKDSQLADRFKASKTPHVFVQNLSGDIVYQGGVSNSSDFSTAERKFLREALRDLTNGKEVKTPKGRTLGCAITRGEKNVW